jgi:hypothetical protein
MSVLGTVTVLGRVVTHVSMLVFVECFFGEMLCVRNDLNLKSHFECCLLCCFTLCVSCSPFSTSSAQGGCRMRMDVEVICLLYFRSVRPSLPRLLKSTPFGLQIPDEIFVSILYILWSFLALTLPLYGLSSLLLPCLQLRMVWSRIGNSRWAFLQCDGFSSCKPIPLL